MDNGAPSPRQTVYVGYVLKRYPRFSETFVVNEILAHERAGMKVDIFALGPVSETHFQDGIARVKAPVTRYKDRQYDPEIFWQLLQTARERLPDFDKRMTQVQWGSPHSFAQAIKLALDVQARGIQHLHAHFGTLATTVARLAAIFSGVTYSFTAHAKDIYYCYGEPTELDIKLRDAACVVTVSDYNLAYLRKKYGACAERLVRLYNGVDLQQFPYSPPAQHSKEILAVGRLVRKKGFDVLIEAVSLLKQRGLDFHCTLIGNGDLFAPLQRQIDTLKLHDRMTLAGSKPQQEVIAEMRQAAMLVAPCVISDDGDRDGLPTVLLEAMALGTPVVSTTVAGIPEVVINQKTGLCIPPQNPHALADAIACLLNDADQRFSLSHHARALISAEYDINRNASRLRDMFSASVRP
ncbi:glycosyltransferase [Brenneria rubrifaciens]|uniref:Colanic acid biosynthesis glycosyltransferase WcaL n=1 Tax=Brenneria rubrifaciens TaxID=55213 RepID=A0A4P8QRE5_9GAMM|nr:glycosyltransferase [Brenneria rubrifaciens]QCR09702.1 colanic acid biosynthesis glycosyltransferase WcaL [Brenneria rubrifaciens]